jgi:hypothetical protein
MRKDKVMRKLFIGFSLMVTALLILPANSQAMKWQGRRQSSNVIDIRAETKAVNTQLSLEAGRRYLVAMMMMAEKDAGEQPGCVTLGQEIEKLKRVRAELEGMGTEPVRRLICADEAAGSRVNLCAKTLAKDPAAAPAFPDLQEFEEELTDNYGPAMEQVGRIQASLDSKNDVLTKEDVKCRATLQLIQKKSAEVLSAYGDLQRMIHDLGALGQ